MSTVYLHIGMPKTGTTALQMFLPLNESVLSQKGFCYPLMPFEFENIGKRRNAHFLSLWTEKDSAPEWEQGFNAVKEALFDHDNVILSDENLWSRQRLDDFWENVCSGFSDIGADIKVIVYLRSQDDQVESNWNQKVKDKKTRMQISFAQFMEEERYYYMPFDYGEALDRISSYIGRDNLLVRVYEKQQFAGGSIFADFLEVLGLGFSEEYKLPEFTPNVRLPNSAVEIKRLINSAYEGEDIPDIYREIISRAFDMKHRLEIPERTSSMFSPLMREKFMSKYAEGNAYVAREYLHRADGVLFRGNLSSIPQWKMNDHEILLDMIRIFATEGVYLYNRETRIKERELELERKLREFKKVSNSRHMEHSGRLAELEKKLLEIYNSAPFRFYRKLRDKKDGQDS